MPISVFLSLVKARLGTDAGLGFTYTLNSRLLLHRTGTINPLTAAMILVAVNSDTRMTSTYHKSRSQALTGLKLCTDTGQDTLHTFALIRASDHAHFLTRSSPNKGQPALTQKRAMNVQFGGSTKWKDCFPCLFMLKRRHLAHLAPNRCASQATHGWLAPYSPFGWTPPTSPCPPFLLSQNLSPGENSPGSYIITKSLDALTRL